MFYTQHAFALDILLDKLHSECKVLDVGSGSGYLTACFARAITSKEGANTALVVGIEHQPELVKKGIDNINKDDSSLLEAGKVLIVGKDKNDLWEVAMYTDGRLKEKLFFRGGWKTWISTRGEF